jgi:ribosomal protein S18 acetylase RimI-like enzyme
MTITYFKRFRMEVELRDVPPPPPLPDGFFWVPWDENLVDVHADVHYRAFCAEIDSALFPCFGDRAGCQNLLREIRRKPGFLPQATWLVACAETCCGTVQGVCDRAGYGAIQNIGVIPRYRGLGLGAALLLQALDGFRSCGLERVYLEVTADNDGAVRLYHRLGFRKMKTVYKAVDA